MAQSPAVPLFLFCEGLVALLVGLLILRAGLRGRRRGVDPHCRRCDYLLVGIDSAKCPECGAALTPRNVVRGERLRRRGAIWVRAPMAGAGLLLSAAQVMPVYRAVDWYRLKPTGWVIDDLEDPALRRKAVVELSRRIEVGSFPPRHRGRAADVALAEQGAATPSVFARSMVEWLARWASDGSLDSQRRERYFRQLVRLQLTVRPTVRAGDPVPIEFGFVTRGPQQGIYIVVERAEILLDGKTVRRHGGSSSGGTGFGNAAYTSDTVPCESPGPHEVAVRVRLSVHNGPTSKASAPPLYESEQTLTAKTLITTDAAAAGVKLVKDPALKPALQAAFRPRGFHRGEEPKELWGEFDIAPLSFNVAFDVIARVGGREYPLNSLTLRHGALSSTVYGNAFDAPDTAQVDIILRTSEAAARRTVNLFDAWDGELVFPNVPLEDRRPRK